MKQICKFDKVRDITPTNPDLNNPIKETIRTGIVKDTSATAFYNMQKELGEVGMRISDEFDFIEYDNALRKYRKAMTEKDED